MASIVMKTLLRSTRSHIVHDTALIRGTALVRCSYKYSPDQAEYSLQQVRLTPGNRRVGAEE